jgi:hypothetical protein
MYKTREVGTRLVQQEFYPFINTTARGEGTNAGLQRNVGPSTMLPTP